MAFEDLKDLLVWFADSHALIEDIKDRLEYDPSCALTRMLEGLLDFYDPRVLVNEQVVTEQQLMNIYRRIFGFDKDDGDTNGVEHEAHDIDDVEIDDLDGVEEMTRRYKADGRIARAIGMGEMADILGYNPKAFRRFLGNNTPPIQYAWRAGTAYGRGRWRFSVEQIDNFKRWLANLGKMPEQPREIEPGRSVHEAGGSMPVGMTGNVYEMEDAEYSCPHGDF